MRDLFRKAALEKISSPEQLDHTITITSPLSWLAIVGIAIILGAFVVWAFFGSLPSSISASGIMISGSDTVGVHSPRNGILSRYYVGPGDNVEPGDRIAELRDVNGNTFPVVSTQRGIVTGFRYELNDHVEKYAEIVSLSPTEGEEEVILCYFPVDEGKAVTEGMDAIITPSFVDEQKSGHMEASVILVDDYITSPEDIKRLLGNNDLLVNEVSSGSAMVMVVLEIKKDESTRSGYYWSNKKGADIEVRAGTICTVQITTDKSSPVSRIFPDSH